MKASNPEEPPKKPEESTGQSTDSLFSRFMPESKIWQYNRMWQWFFSFPEMAQLLLHDGFEGQLDPCVDLPRLEVSNPDKQDVLGKHRIEDLNCKVPLILTPEAQQSMRETLDLWGQKNVELPTKVRITVLCEHKRGVSYEIFRQGFEQVSGEIIESMNKARQTGVLFPLLEPVLILFCVHGPIHFPQIDDLAKLIMTTGHPFIDACRPSIKFKWFDLNALDDSRFFNGTNPVEYDGVLNILKGADCDNFSERLEVSLDRMRPKSDNPWVTVCADKILLFAASLKDRIAPKELNRISRSFQPLVGEETMESKTVLEQMAEMFEEEGIQKGIQRGIQKGIQTGIQRGIQTGIQRGIQTGIQRCRAKSILDLLTRRFGPVSQEVQQAINSLHDEPVLDSYFNTAIDCQSLEEFERDLFR